MWLWDGVEKKRKKYISGLLMMMLYFIKPYTVAPAQLNCTPKPLHATEHNVIRSIMSFPIGRLTALRLYLLALGKFETLITCAVRME